MNDFLYFQWLRKKKLMYCEFSKSKCVLNCLNVFMYFATWIIKIYHTIQVYTTQSVPGSRGVYQDRRRYLVGQMISIKISPLHARIGKIMRLHESDLTVEVFEKKWPKVYIFRHRRNCEHIEMLSWVIWIDEKWRYTTIRKDSVKCTMS